MDLLKEKASRLNVLLLYLLGLIPIMGLKISVWLIIAFTVVSGVSGLIWGRREIEKVHMREALILLFPFLLIFFRTFILDRTDSAHFYLEVSMSLFAFPIAFFLSPVIWRQRQVDLFSFTFIVTTTAIVLYGQLKAVFRLIQFLGAGKFWPTREDMFQDPSFPFLFRTLFEENTRIHPTYASVFLGISILLILSYLLRNGVIHTARTKSLGIGILIINTVLLVMLAARSPILATFFSAGLLFFISQKKKRTALLIAGSAAVFSIFLIILVPQFSSRFKEISISGAENPKTVIDNSFNIRLGILNCSSKIINENWLFGVGPGNVQSELNKCYGEIMKPDYAEKNYNTHNQFMDYWAGLGIFGPLSLFLLLLYTSVRNYLLKNYLALSLSLLFLVVMMTENLLNRQNGIVVFALFTSLFFFTQKKERVSHNGQINK